MEGVDWTMMSALVVDEGDKLSVTLYPIATDACDQLASSDTEMLFTVPKEEGEYRLYLDLATFSGQTVTFVTGPGQNVISTEGLLVVESLSDTEVTIGIVADADNNSINGRFTSTICPGT